MNWKLFIEIIFGVFGIGFTISSLYDCTGYGIVKGIIGVTLLALFLALIF